MANPESKSWSENVRGRMAWGGKVTNILLNERRMTNPESKSQSGKGR